jgi:hypothetical protein
MRRHGKWIDRNGKSLNFAVQYFVRVTRMLFYYACDLTSAFMECFRVGPGAFQIRYLDNFRSTPRCEKRPNFSGNLTSKLSSMA